MKVRVLVQFDGEKLVGYAEASRRRVRAISFASHAGEAAADIPANALTM